MIEQENYYIVHYWMVDKNCLNLTGTELHIFAIIYSYSRGQLGKYIASLDDLSEFSGVTKSGMTKALKKLIAKKYIIKELCGKNEQKCNSYKINFDVVNSIKAGRLSALGEGSTQYTPGGQLSIPQGVNSVYPRGSTQYTPGSQLSIPNKDILINNNKNNIKDDSSMSDSVQKIGNYWNDYVQGTLIKPIIKLTPHTKRYESLNARCNEYGYDKVIEAIGKIKNSDFLQGKNSKGWVITFDWFVLPNNFPKVLEGNYDNHQANSGSGRYEY